MPNDILSSDADFDGIETPVPLYRNLTFRGVLLPGGWRPVWDSAYISGKMRMVNTSVTWYDFIVVRSRKVLPNVAPGSDILAPCAKGDRGYTACIRCFVVQRLCYPPSMHLEALKGAVRPPVIPGTQVYNPFVSQEGCVNTTAIPIGFDAVQLAPNGSEPRPDQWCWPHRGYYEDLGMYCADLNKEQKQVATGYTLNLVNATYVCDDIFTLDCVQRFGGLGCYNVWPNYTVIEAASQPLALTKQAAAADEGGDDDGGGNSTGAIIGGVVGGVVGGLLLAALVVGAVLLHRRRKEREAARAAAAAGKGGAEGANGAQKEAHTVVHCWPGSAGQGSAATTEDRDSGGGLHSERGPLDVVSESAGEDGKQPPSPAAQNGGACASPALLVGSSGVRPTFSPFPASVTSAATGAPASSFGRASGNSSVRQNGQVRAPGSASTDFEGAMEMAVVTLATPQRVAADAEVLLDPRVSLLPDRVLGKGSFGRVLEGRYQGRAVAVKLLHELPSLGHTAGKAGAGQPKAAQSDPHAPGPNAAAAAASPQEPGALGGAASSDPAAAGVVDEAVAKAASAQDSQPPGLPTALHEPFENLTQEVEVLGRCKHPNVVELLAACLTPPRCALVMELCDTSLERLMYGSPGNLLPMDTVFDVATDVARGLHYLHPTIVHRDLKPGNVLVNNPPGRRLVAKLSDFGLSRIHSTVLVTEHPEVGTPAYMAPELFDVTNFIVSHKADIFSFGVLLWAMLSGQEPWKGHNCVQVAYAILMLGQRLPYGSIPSDRRHPRMMSLIESCWDSDPARRPAAADVLKLLLLAQEEYERSGQAAAGDGERPTPPPPLVPPPETSEAEAQPAPPRALQALQKSMAAMTGKGPANPPRR
ncbi:hypothetical protein HYH03_018975 [Edaphochlamys debaryana]|uniref:Protein kinase domain-containing protein n=1 Tax=Edaphochlamys debaryana TaxID=47281 RepID=A0A836BML6_9CHLO|nr:hypothetical protein HYH03_018975 [Edaphochlamys debaryana]|eukprot:KAG2482065.1 hypothetical protein HYH03_018975 [Edaphochlamys debaryana]